MISNTNEPKVIQHDSFTDDLVVKSLGTKWELYRAFNFYYLDGDKKTDVSVPVGFITDFASTPVWLYSFFPPIGLYNKAATLHDYLYNIECPVAITRREADLFFLQAMEVLKVPKLQRILMYLAVRLGGASRFRKPSKLTNPVSI